MPVEICGGIQKRAAIAMALDPARNPSLPIDWDPKPPYMPFAPGTIIRPSKSLDRIMKNLKSLSCQIISIIWYND